MKLEDSKKAINYLNDFLDMFNLHTKIKDDSLLKEIVIQKGVPVYDECENIIGLISLSNGKFFIFVFKDNFSLKINIKLDDKQSIVFDYFIDDKNNIYNYIKGSSTMFDSNNKNTIINNLMDIFYNNKRYRCKFNTVRNRFKISSMYDYNNASYSNNEFSHSNRDEEVSIENDYGNVIYSKTSSNKEKENLHGETKISYDNKSYDIVTKEFNSILNDIDPNYYELVDEVKNAVNYFEPNLFENTVKKSIKSDLSVLKIMLNIKEDGSKKISV